MFAIQHDDEFSIIQNVFTKVIPSDILQKVRCQVS